MLHVSVIPAAGGILSLKATKIPRQRLLRRLKRLLLMLYLLHPCKSSRWSEGQSGGGMTAGTLAGMTRVCRPNKQ